MATFRSMADARWYLYKSAPKIESLYGQMFGSKKPTKKSLHVISPYGTVGFDSDAGAPDLEDKLRIIEAELHETRALGSLDEPADYVAGLMPMRWGMFNDSASRPEGAPALVYFGGFIKDEPLIVGLGGSTVNVVGYQGASSTHSRSNTTEVARWLLAGVEGWAAPSLPDWWDMDNERYQLFTGAAIALHYLRPPTQNLQFVARTLAFGKVTSPVLEHFVGVQTARVIIATPLWVAAISPMHEGDRWGLDEEWNNPATE